MALDSLVLAWLARELDARLAGSRVQGVVAPDDKRLALEVYPPRDGWLTFSIDPRMGHVALLAQRPAPAPTPTPMLLLARSRLEGARVTAIACPGPDRIMHVDLAGGGRDGPRVHRLVLELTGPTADLHLVEGGRVIGHLRKGPLPARMAGGTYAPPPLPDRLDPLGLSGEERVARLEEALASGTAGALHRTFHWIGPGLASLVARSSPADGARALAGYLERVAAGRLEPWVHPGGGGPQVFLAPLAGLEVAGAAEGHATVNDAIVRGFLPAHDALLVERRRVVLERAVEEAHSRERGRLEGAREGLARARRWPDLERMGILLKSQMEAIEPRATVVHVVDFEDPTGPGVDIPIKRGLSPRQNVERLFAHAKRLKLSISVLERRVREHEDGLSVMDSLAAEVRSTQGREEIARLEERVRALTRAVAPAPGGHTQKKGHARAAAAGRKAEPMSFVSTEGYRILVGRSAAENDLLTKRLARPHDLWLHAEGAAGAHVVVRLAGRQARCPDRTLDEAAKLAAHYSKARYDTRVTVLVARAGQVRKPPGAAPGSVTVRGAHTSIVVRTDPSIASRLAAPF